MKGKNNRRILIFGRPGSGKTTLTVLEIIEALKQGRVVYTNIQIHWFGDLFRLTPIHKLLNKIYSLTFSTTTNQRNAKLVKLYAEKDDLDYRMENVQFDENRIPNEPLTQIFYKLWFIKKDIEKIKEKNHNIEYGWIKEHYFEPSKYRYCEDLETAVKDLIQDSSANKDNEYLLAFDEGFVDLDFSRKVPNYVTNFFNQSRKLAVDVIISSQRPVAVYPGYRALCDYMVLVEKNWFGWFSSKKYFVDADANALPNLSKDAEGKDKGKGYRSWNGKAVFPFFDTRQSIGLKKLLGEIIKK